MTGAEGERRKAAIMRTGLALTTLMLALLPGAAGAQEAGTPGQPPGVTVPSATPWTGILDFGARGTSTDGDAARYERYRDLGDGFFLEDFRVSRAHSGWLLDFTGEHAGRRDQRYIGTVDRPGRFRGQFRWDQIPMLLSGSTRTLYTGIGTGELRIDDALQAQVQASPVANLPPVFDQFSRGFDTRTRRHIAEGIAEYFATPELTFSANVRRTDREGTIPFGGSFGHSSLVEFPAPTDHNLSEVEAGAEWVRDPYLLRAGYSGSWFHNDVTSVIFDNPFRATSIAGASSVGRLTLAPSSSFIGVNGLASMKLPYRSRATAYLSVGSLKDAGDPLVPLTINSALSAAPLERATVQGEARTTAVNLTFVSRPRRDIDVDVRYRAYDYDNQTPEFALSQRVSYDNTISNLAEPVHTEPFGLLRHTVDADVRFTPLRRTTAGVGYTRVVEDRTHRIFESTADNVFRVVFDTLGREWFSLRTKYEHGRRRGEGIEQGIQMLIAIGEQPGMRHFDIASRNRNRVTALASFTPLGNLAGSFSFAAGKDDFIDSEFGLRDNTHTVYGTSVDYLPTDRLTLAAAYSYERYDALNRSRQANPGDQFTNPARNWAADQADRSHTVTLSAAVARIAERADLRLAYNVSRARARYEYITGPVADRTLPEEVVVPTELPTPTELPPTLSELQGGTADFVYTLTSRLSLGVSYWYERYRVRDFTLDIDANPVLPRGQALLMGYLYRPYTANTFWGRLIVAF